MQLITVDGRAPAIAEGAWIAPGAVVAGRVTIGTGTGVWYTAVVRADTAEVTVGEGTSIQDGTVVHADPGFPASIGDNVTVGHRAVVHGCTVEDDCLIGMNATVLNGAVIGWGSLVAGGAVVLEDTEVPPRSLVAGVPAKVRRPISDEELERIRANAATYRELAAQYRSQGL